MQADGFDGMDAMPLMEVLCRCEYVDAEGETDGDDGASGTRQQVRVRPAKRYSKNTVVRMQIRAYGGHTSRSSGSRCAV
jgi:hypothetical protein